MLVAIANKHARQLWAMLAHEETYDPDAWLKHPMVQRPAGKHAITVSRHGMKTVPRQREAVATGQTHPERT